MRNTKRLQAPLFARGVARIEHQHLVDHRDLEVRHEGGTVGNGGSDAAAPD